MKKIFINKKDNVAEVVEKIIAEADLEITLVIPRESDLDDSLSNFNLIRREASAVDKRILIESVDEKILNLAKAAHLEAVHPILKRERSSLLSDIVLREEKAVPLRVVTEEKKKRPARAFFVKGKSEEQFFKSPEELPAEPAPAKTRSFKPRKILWWAVPLLILTGVIFVLNSFRKAEVVINFELVPLSYEGNLVASAGTNRINEEAGILPAELFTEVKNLTELFSASSRKNVSEKAKGKIVVYNAYSSQKQTLVVGTRFQTPDGKVFRLQNEISVPGAQIKDGKIIPSSIETSVIADKAGPSYNLGAVEKLAIPGFKGSPKYDKFYGSLIKSSGGFIGEKAVPTDKDIAAAKERITATLKSSLNSNLTLEKPEGFQILEEALDVKIIKISVNPSTDDKGQFSVFGEAERKSMGFRDQDLRSFLLSLAQKDQSQMVVKDLKLDFKDAKANFEKRELKFALVATGVLTPEFKPDQFKLSILGKSIRETQSLIKDLKGLKDGKVSIWPAWLKNLPKNPKRIDITVN